MLQQGVESSLTRLKISSEARQAEEERIDQRKRAALVLILHHLQRHGYLDSVERLQNESGVSLRKVTAADNIDLMYILQEFESYYAFKFGKAPRLVRKNADGELPPSSSAKSQHGQNSSRTENTPTQAPNKISRSRPLPKIGSGARLTAAPPLSGASSLSSMNPVAPGVAIAAESADRKADVAASINTKKQHHHAMSNPSARLLSNEPLGPGLAVTGHRVDGHDIALSAPVVELLTRHQESLYKPHPMRKNDALLTCQHTMATQKQHQKLEPQTTSLLEDTDLYNNRLLRPLPDYVNSEFRELAAIISRDIFIQNPNVKFSDIAGLETSKRLIKEAIVFPIKFPSLFTGILSPWKGLLLFGPPGTGKTMLAKAAATECKTTFFNISASSIVSKWRGDSEKLIRVLFELARHHSPSTIFLDELESIMSQRSSDGEHEGSRRMKTELLIQMDGLFKGNEHIFILAASNLPWDLDVAMLRRLEKRILVDLPDHCARKAIFAKLLPPDAVDDQGTRVVGDLDYDELAQRTQGYSGSDISLVCREAAMRPLRAVLNKLEALSIDINETQLNSTPDTGAHNDETSLPTAHAIGREPIQMDDALAAIDTTRPTNNPQLSAKYQEWQKSFAST